MRAIRSREIRGGTDSFASRAAVFWLAEGYEGHSRVLGLMQGDAGDDL